MGFGQLVFGIILASAVIIGMFTMNSIYQSKVESIKTSLSEQKAILDQQLKGTINITNITLIDGNPDKTIIVVENTGKLNLDYAYLDVYIDEIFIPRIAVNRTIEIIPSTDIDDIGIWNPREKINITVFGNIDVGYHTALISTEFGNTDNITFSKIPNELLNINNGTWSPDNPGPLFDANEMAAVNNDGGLTITLSNGAMTDDVGLEAENISGSPTTILKVDVLVDYSDTGMADNDLLVEVRNSTYDGLLFCTNSYNSSLVEITITLECGEQHSFSHEDLDNLYINMRNQKVANQDIIVDYVRTYIEYEE